MMEMVPWISILFVITLESVELNATFRVRATGLADAAVAGVFQIALTNVASTPGQDRYAAQSILRFLMQRSTSVVFFAIDENHQPLRIFAHRIRDVTQYNEILVLIRNLADPENASEHSSYADSEHSVSL